jgi:hypothetical protein
VDDRYPAVVRALTLATASQEGTLLSNLRDLIFAAPDLTFEDIEVPEWGCTVRIKGMTAAERDDFEASRITGKGKNRDVNLKNMRAALLVRVIVDPATDELVFTKADIFRLGEKSAGVLDRLFDKAQILSGIRDEDVEELVGNSEPGQSDDSPSA